MRTKQNMRKQDYDRLKRLCSKLEIDWEEFDFVAYNYHEVKQQIYERAGDVSVFGA